MKNNAVEPIKLITCIVNRGDGETVTELCAREGISCSVVLRGRGTADNAMLTMLGLGESEKDIVMLTVGQSRQGEIMEKLAVTLHLNERGKGIAVSIPFSGLASQLDSYALLAGMKASANLIDLN